MKKRLFLMLAIVAIVCLFAISVSATPTKPALDVAFGEVQAIEGFTAPSQLYVNTDERVLLTDGNGNYVTYPTYYITKDSTTFDVNFTNLNQAQSVQYTKASVVMLEVPEGVTTLSAAYFSDSSNAFSQMVYTQLPGTVTNYNRRLFFRNMTVKIVEFLDGTEPVTLGDEMFGGDNTGGSRGTAVEYVKFPNNMVSLGKSTFYKNYAVKVIIFGESLETIASPLFNESFPEGSDKAFYASEKLLRNADGVVKDMFGSVGAYNNKRLNIKLYTTGSLADAEAFVEAGKAVQSGYVWDKAYYFSADDFNYEEDSVGGYNNISFIYGYNKCEAFYGGVHSGEAINGCQVVCSRCGNTEIMENPVHDSTLDIQMGENGFFGEITVVKACANCNLEELNEKVAPIFTARGYSRGGAGNAYGVTQKFLMDKKALSDYELYTGIKLEYGVIAAAGANVVSPLVVNEGVVSTVNNKVILSKFTGSEYDYFDIKISNIDAGNLDTSIAMNAYVFDGTNLYYLDDGVTSNTAVSVTYNATPVALVPSKEEE